MNLGGSCCIAAFPQASFSDLNNEVGLSKATTLAIAAREAVFRRPAQPKSVAAVINVFNESDILDQVVRYLRDQSVEVHIIDNWSTDGSYEIAKTLLAQDICSNVIHFPSTPLAYFDYRGLCGRIRRPTPIDWIILQGADEFRCAP
jgi:hypothetical protein